MIYNTIAHLLAPTTQAVHLLKLSVLSLSGSPLIYWSVWYRISYWLVQFGYHSCSLS